MEGLLQEKEQSKLKCEEYRQMIQTLNDKNQKLEKDRSKSSSREKELQSKIVILNKTLQDKTSDLTSSCEQNCIKANEISDKSLELIKIRKVLEETEQIVNSQKEQINDKNEVINSLNDLVIKLNEDINTLKVKQNKTDTDTKDLNSLKQMFENLQHDQESLKSTDEDLKSKYLSSVEEVENYNSEKSKSRLKEQEYQGKIQQLSDEKLQLVSTHEKEILELEEKLLCQKNEAEIDKKKLEQKIELLESDNKDELISKLKSDLKKKGVLLKDAQNLVSKLQNENCKKSLIKQMKSQIEDLEAENLSLSRSKKLLNNDVEEMKLQVEDLLKSKSRVEDKCSAIVKENSSLSNQLGDTEEELHELLKKHKNNISTIAADKVNIQEQSFIIIELEHESEKLKEKNCDLQYKIDKLESDTVDLCQYQNAKMKITELEQKLDLEQTNKFRLEHLNERLKDNLAKMEKENEIDRIKHQSDQEKHKKLVSQFRDLKEDYMSLQVKESDIKDKNMNLNKKIEITESENIILKKDLELAMKRIKDFHTAITSDIDSDSDTITYSDDDSSFASRPQSLALELNEASMLQ